jgi:hypothetical protein
MYSATTFSVRDPAKRNEKVPRRESSQPTASDCIVGLVKALAQGGRFAERIVSGLDDAGRSESVVIWIEWKPGALWAVGRMVNPEQRDCIDPRRDDYVWEGFELGDCLEIANEWLEDDCVVSEEDGGHDKVLPFTRDELVPRLEQIFFAS